MSRGTIGRRVALGAWSVVAALAGGACGAKTGLRAPDVHVEDARVARPDAFDVVDAADAQDVPAVCVDVRFALERRGAEALLVIDRSTSMSWGLNGSTATPPSRWSLLRDALSSSLPTFERVLGMGAVFFPSRLSGDSCGVSAALDVDIRLNNAAAINAMMAATSPGGTTPTNDAVRFAGQRMLARPGRDRTRNLVLATDGAPNCNDALDDRTCPCTSGGGSSAPGTCVGQAALCRDEARTIATITEFARQGVPTFVIGIDEDGRPDLVDVLNRMADAGGRPNTLPGGQRYYSVRRREDLAAAFATVQRALATCTYFATSVPPTPDDADVQLGPDAVPRDRDHRDGWDWTDAPNGEVTLFGSWCDRALAGNMPLSGNVECRDRD
jgi:hypothetical protein